MQNITVDHPWSDFRETLSAHIIVGHSVQKSSSVCAGVIYLKKRETHKAQRKSRTANILRHDTLETTTRRRRLWTLLAASVMS